MDKENENKLTDQLLIKQVLNGDVNAFGIIIKNTERLVGQIVFKMISDYEDRKDVAQDIYVKAYKGLSSFKIQSKLSTWIAQISYNTCLNYLEKKKLNYLTIPHETVETDEEVSGPVYQIRISIAVLSISESSF